MKTNQKLVISALIMTFEPLASFLCASFANHYFAYPKSATWETSEAASVFFVLTLFSGYVTSLGFFVLMWTKKFWMQLLSTSICLIINGLLFIIIDWKIFIFPMSLTMSMGIYILIHSFFNKKRS